MRTIYDIDTPTRAIITRDATFSRPFTPRFCRSHDSPLSDDAHTLSLLHTTYFRHAQTTHNYVQRKNRDANLQTDDNSLTRSRKINNKYYTRPVLCRLRESKSLVVVAAALKTLIIAGHSPDTKNFTKLATATTE